MIKHCIHRFHAVIISLFNRQCHRYRSFLDIAVVLAYRTGYRNFHIESGIAGNLARIDVDHKLGVGTNDDLEVVYVHNIGVGEYSQNLVEDG